VLLNLSNFIKNDGTQYIPEEYELICWREKDKCRLYFNKRTGKFKAVGGCNLVCIRAMVFALKFKVRMDENREEIEKSIISTHL